MRIKGKLSAVYPDIMTGRHTIAIQMLEGNITEIEKYKDKDLTVEIKQYRKMRSNDANAMLWACLSEIAEAFGGDKWDYYLQALRKYGQYTLVEMDKEAVPKFRMMYRECEVIGERDGMVQLMCYYGSSTYNTKEFSVLLDGVIDDMKQAGLEVPPSEEMRRALEAWGKN